MMYDNKMSRKTCETCGSIRKNHGLLPYQIIPEEVIECTEITVFKNVILCANCRKEIANWNHDKVYKVSYAEKRQQFIPLAAEKLAKEYESVYSAFYAHKRLIRIIDKFSKNK